MRFLTATVSLALTFVFAASVATASTPLAIKMEVEGGFDGYYKVGEWIPLAVTLSNDGPALEGKVWLEALDEAGGATVYSKPLSLPSRSKKRIYLYAYSTGFMRNADINFQVGNDVVASAKVTLRPLQANDYLLGIASGDPSTGNFLSGVKLPSLQAQGSGRTTVVHIPLSQIPSQAQALKSLDVLTFSDVSTGELEMDQRQAIESWVSGGGVLLVAGGVGGQKTAAGLQSVLPFRVTGTRNLDAVTGLEELAGAPVRASGPFLASVVNDAADGDVLARQDGIPLVIQHGFGQGRILFLALDISAPPLNSWLEDGLFWKRVLANDFSTTSSNGITKHTGTAANMQSALSNIPAMDLPPVTSLAVFLLVYILSIGPANYLVLRRLDKREWAWVTIPALTLGFTGAAYAIGFGIKGGDIIVHEITVLRTSYDSPLAEADAYIGIFSPARRTYQLEVGDGMLLSKPRSFGGPGLASQVEVIQGEPAQIKDVNVNAWAMQPFMAEGFVSLDGQSIRSELRVEGERIKGTITNATDAGLEDAVLLNAGKIARIGTLNPGETKDVDVTLQDSGLNFRMSVGSMIIGDQQPAMGIGDDRDKMRKRMIVDGALGTAWTWSKSELSLLGWQKKSPLDISLKGQRVIQQSTVLLIASLRVSFGHGSISVPSGFASRRFVDTSTAKVGLSPYGFMLGDGGVTIRYQLSPEVAGLTVKELSLHFQQQAGKAPGAVNSIQPSLQLFDWGRGKWVEQGKISAGVTSIAQPASFVSSSGAIEAKLDVPSGGYFEVSQLDFSVKGER